MKRFVLFALLAMSLLAANAAADAGSAEAVVQRQLDAYNAHDLEAFLATYSDDAELVNFPAAPRSKGKEAMRTRYGRAFADATLHATITQRIAMDSTVIDREHVRWMLPDGPGTVDAIAIYEVRDGKIAKVTFIMGAQKLDAAPRARP